MFKDKFLDGPLEGEEWDVSEDTIEGNPIRHRATGIEYVRTPESDTAEFRAWRMDRIPDPGQMRPFSHRDKHGITLGDLRDFAMVALQDGWPEDTRVRSVSNWRLRLQKIETPETPERKEK